MKSMMNKRTGIIICSVLLVIGGCMQLFGAITGTAVLSFVAFGSLALGIVMLVAAYGIWKVKTWGRTLGAILGAVELLLGITMGMAVESYVDFGLAMTGLIILYLLLIDKNTRAAFSSPR